MERRGKGKARQGNGEWAKTECIKTLKQRMNKIYIYIYPSFTGHGFSATVYPFIFHSPSLSLLFIHAVSIHFFSSFFHPCRPCSFPFHSIPFHPIQFVHSITSKMPPHHLTFYAMNNDTTRLAVDFPCMRLTETEMERENVFFLVWFGLVS